jgi:integrase
VKSFGRSTRVADLEPENFRRLRTSMAKTLGAVGLGNEINRVRMVFKFAYDEGLIDKPVRYGQGFKRPSKKTLRKTRAANGKRMFEAEELRQILKAARQPLEAMILLGINAGLGQTDLAQMPISAVDLKRGWLDYPRPKTGIDRRSPLWPETVKAIREAIKHRPEPNEENEDTLFLTHHGKRWVRLNENNTPNDEIGKQFAKLLKELGIKRPGVSFYALRHTFETIGGESRDQVAVDHIMGHARDDMASLYRERISDERLKAVTDTIHNWLFAEDADDSGE